MAAYKQVVEELHKPARRRYLRRKFEMRGINDTYQADLVDMKAYSDVNRGYKYILTVINVFSKFGWGLALKNKTGPEVTKAMATILSKEKPVRNIQVDSGSEFYCQPFQNLMKEHKINLYSTFSNLKASICERYNRTLKTKMFKKFTLNVNYKWIDLISELVEEYNNSKHRTIGMKPKDVTKKHEARLLRKYKTMEARVRQRKSRFKIGNKVRISKYKHIFEKAYTPNFTSEIFEVTKVLKTKPTTYLLKDYNNQPISGCFYEEELCKTKYPDVYIIEKILRRRKNELLIQWLGFPTPSWINKKDIES